MVSEAQQETSYEAATELLRHLRHRPDDAHDPKALAERFGLSEGLVAAVVAGARRSEPPTSHALNRRLTLDWPKRAARWAGNRFLQLTAKPAAFVGASTVVAIVLSVVIERMEPTKSPKALGPLTSYDLAALGVVLATGIAHCSLYYRKGMARHPLIGAAVVWLMILAASCVSLFVSNGRDKTLFERVGTLALEALGFGMVGLLYGGTGVVVALLGAYAKTRTLDRQDEQMTRAQLLDRYFELQKRLQKGSTRQRVADWLETSVFARVFRRGVYPVAIAFTVAMGALSILIEVVQKFTLDKGHMTSLSWALGVFKAGSMSGYLVLWITVGLFAGSISRALTVMTVVAIEGYLLVFLPAPGYGPEKALGVVTILSSLSLMLVSYVVAGFSALAADIQRYNARDQRLADNDPTLLLAEMLRIQWRLAEETSNVCVMVVDAAKSAQMKAEADPLTAEYSFREYQEWLADIAKSFGGKVTATVGDGAIFEFTECESAFRASRRVHTDLDRFNREINRLATPFRLRIGLHIGEVVGDINEVQFTEVIDIAAHVQGAAPVGGIAVTGAVASCLTSEKFLPLADPIDNQPVLIAIESVED